jgi:hypothetical protein
MNPEIISYDSDGSKINFLAIIKNGIVIDIACSTKDFGMYSKESCVSKEDISIYEILCWEQSLY